MIHWNFLLELNLVGNQVKCILFLYLDQRDGHSCGKKNIFLWRSAGPRPSQYRVPEFHALLLWRLQFLTWAVNKPHILTCSIRILSSARALCTATLTSWRRTYWQLACVETQEKLVRPSVGVWFHWKTWPPSGMASARGRGERSDGRRETGQRNSFADSGVNSDTRPITGHGPRKETLPKLQSRESRRGSVLRLPIMGTSFESNSGYGCPDRVVLIQRAHYLPIHGMSDWRRGAITLNCLFATSVIFSCII